MKYYKYWTKNAFEIEIGGQLQTINLLTGSNQSEEAASQKAVEKAKDIERRIAERKPKDSYQVAIKEHVNEVIDDSNIITVCRYGAKILNTTSHTILDLDDYPVHLIIIIWVPGRAILLIR